jgi:hypothetical protein
MVGEFWFYVTMVLICTGYALLMQSYPQWKLYFSIGLAGVIVAGGALVYWDAKKREDVHTKMGQLERDLEVAKKEAAKQESLVRDAKNEAHLLGEQLKVKSDELSRVLKDKPHIDGEINRVRIFPWQRASEAQHRTDEMSAATGVLVAARIANQGSSTPLTNWELSIELADHTIILAQKWPVKKTMRILCKDASLTVSKDEYLDAKSTEAIQRTEERSGITIWMVKNIPLGDRQIKNSVYTLTARDNTGVIHALKTFSLVSLPQQCSGFQVLD